MKQKSENRKRALRGLAEIELTRIGGGKMIAGVNVRRDERWPEMWRSAGVPRTVREDGWMPAGVTRLSGTPGKQAEWFSRGNVLGYALGTAGETVKANAAVKTLCTLKGELTGVTDVEAGSLRLTVKGARAVYAGYDKEGVISYYGEMPQLPTLRLESREGRDLTVSTGSVGLSGQSDVHGTTLTDSDTAAVSAAVMRVYEKLKRRFAGIGQFLQPILCRYRLTDGSGSTIVSSLPVLLSGAGGIACRSEIALKGTDGNLGSLDSATMSGRGFEVVLCGMESLPAPWGRMVKKAIVEVCDTEIDPMESEGQCRCRVANDGHGATVYASLPLTGAEARWRAVTMAITTGKGLREHLTVENPLNEGCEAEVAVGSYEMAGAENGRGLMDQLHTERDSVSYDIIAEAGGRYIGAGRRVESFGGCRAECFATSGGSGSWRAVTEVTIERPDGSEEKRQWLSSGESGAPARLSGLLTVPDANAKALSVTINSGGKTVKQSYKLRSVPEAGCACYMSEDMTELTPSESAAWAPVGEISEAEGSYEPGYIGVFADPMLEQETDCAMTGGRVAYVCAAARGSGSWDFSRVKLLIFGSTGTAVMTLNGEGKIHSMAPMDGRPVKERRNVCLASGDKGERVLAIAGGDLVEVDRSGVKTLKRGVDGNSVGWSGRYREVWIGGPAGALRRINIDRPEEEIEVRADALSGRVRMAQSAEGLLAGSDGDSAVCNCDECRHDLLQDVAIALRRLNPRQKEGEPGLQNLAIELTADELHGEAGVWGDNGDGEAEELGAYEIDGNLREESVLRMVAPYRRWTEVHVAGRGRGVKIGN